MPQRIAILTSGGDAPGMNAAIRSAVRVAKDRGWEVFGVIKGYQGLIKGDIEELDVRSVSNSIQRGGTILKTSRSKEFETASGMKKAAETLDKQRIDALIVIGGDGTFRGAVAFKKYYKGKIVGIPGTIDNDLYGTDYTIGFHTAVNTAVEAIDKVRDTAESHERFSIVEVMGRASGFIALEVGIASGAEEIIIPEIPFDIKGIAHRLCEGIEKRKKSSSIIVIAEGCGGAVSIAEKLQKLSGHQYRAVILGYLQRGGSPVPSDRMLATKLGAYAIEILTSGSYSVMVGEVGGKLKHTPLEESFKKKKLLDPLLLALAPILAH